MQSLDHHYRSLGGWSFELHEYYNENFFKDLHNPAVQRLADIIDPLGNRLRAKKGPDPPREFCRHMLS